MELDFIKSEGVPIGVAKDWSNMFRMEGPKESDWVEIPFDFKTIANSRPISREEAIDLIDNDD